MDMSTILRMMNMKIIFQCHFLLLVFRRTRRALWSELETPMEIDDFPGKSKDLPPKK